ncbi:MAG TPA: hypothetical protein VFE47_09865 [Tepidisphaeraceae bacterium]|jgi:hypothetical protein|nr:hypothetical protein [Tepidisphaeraceae bacterium]
MKRNWILTFVLGLCTFTIAPSVRATETENVGMRILPAPGKVTVDGKTDDWDLSGGIFACGDVEGSSDRFGVWLHAMYDKDNLYILARWLDPTPMNNPGSVKGDYGFRGDCLQVRIVTAPDVSAAEVSRSGQNDNDAPLVRTTHATCWRDRDKADVIDLEYGRRFNEGKLKDAKTAGAQQAFLESADHKGYTQEIALPWKLLVKEGVEVKPGSRILMTFEPNFTVAGGARLTIKDLFKPGGKPDRVFTFQGNGSWGFATLAPKGNVPPQPVRLADGREFTTRMEGSAPAVDWTGLIRSNLPDGFKPIKISLPQDGYVSLNIFAEDGTVARQLLTCQFLSKGEHEIKWDGLTTPSAHRPGKPVPAGNYTWEGFYHAGIGLKLRGWAANSGAAPWNGFGADHGNPVACATAGNLVYLGWSAGEGDKPLQAYDLQGHLAWKNIRGGIAGAGPIAADATTVYAFNPIGQYAARAIYRVDGKTGQYTEWSSVKSTDLTMKDLWDQVKDAREIPEQPSGLAAGGGEVFVSFNRQNAVLAVDAMTGRVEKKLDISTPSGMALDSHGRLLVISGLQVVSVDVKSGESKTAITPELGSKDWPSAIAVDKAGEIYLGIRGENHQVFVYSPDGKFLRAIGRKGGRALLGPWQPDGMLNVSGITIDNAGQLWVMEDDNSPKRVSVWDGKTGAFKTEYFGATAYGATGGAINPKDPDLMVGQDCEWRIDPKTGKSSCVGVITRDGMSEARFGYGPNGRLYLANTPAFLHGPDEVTIYERLGDAKYVRRCTLRSVENAGKQNGKKTRSVEIWSDVNGDGIEQPDEVKKYDIDLGGWVAGWYMPMTTDLTFYGSLYQLKVTGWTACGAPLYDLNQEKKLPGPADARTRGGMGAQHGHGSDDGKFMLWNCGYGEVYSTVDCYDMETGKFRWSYPSNFTGVHGSHLAIPAEPGLMRGQYDITGVAHLPPPIGDIWIIPTNKGEWHVLTEKGFYLTRLFQGDPTKNVYPSPAVPGAKLDDCPPGGCEEAFGGSSMQMADGRLFVEAGATSFWNAEVTGLDTIRALPGGKLTIAANDVATAAEFRGQYLNATAASNRLTIHKATPTFTGDLDKDFPGAQVVKYSKGEATACRSALAWDDKTLYAAWDVKDPTPWKNGADAPEFMYTRGDTVDLQLGANPAAAKDRREAVLGDLRLSIGPFQGEPTAVIYRKVAAEKHPKFFSSGVEKNYEMQSVLVLKETKIQVKLAPGGKRYVVEAAVPLASLGLSPTDSLTIHGDLGVTHSNQAGNDTALRTYWCNQDTGLVSDEVFELKMNPSAWGEIEFRP